MSQMQILDRENELDRIRKLPICILVDLVKSNVEKVLEQLFEKTESILNRRKLSTMNVEQIVEESQTKDTFVQGLIKKAEYLESEKVRKAIEVNTLTKQVNEQS